MRPKPRPIANDDLTWYWQQSASEMGIASSWGPMVSAAQGAFGGSAAKPDQRMTDAHMPATREAYEADQRKAKAPKLSIKAWLAMSCSSQHPALASIINETVAAFMAAIEAWKGTKHHG